MENLLAFLMLLGALLRLLIIPAILAGLLTWGFTLLSDPKRPAGQWVQAKHPKLAKAIQWLDRYLDIED